MKKIETIQRLFYSIVTAGLLLGGTAANAWHMPSASDTNFELDGNITNDAGNPGDDWSNIKVGPNSAFSDTGIILDPIRTSIFTGGGSKDVRPVSAWKHTEGSVPDKNEILHAAAAAYNINNDLVIYLHGDRFSNDGDAQMGVWFFQDRVTLNSNGTFTGEHREGDVLMLAEFVNGGANANVKLYRWDPNVQKNLTLIAEGVGGTGDNYYFATSNVGPTPAWATYIPKSLVEGYPPNTYPENSFFEGAINLSWIFAGGDMPCFSTFLMETRSSHRADAQLKDFVLGSLDTCKLEVSKSCVSSVLNQDTYETLDHNYTYTVTNSGFGDISDVELHDDMGTPSDQGDDREWSIGGVDSGQEKSGSYLVTDSNLNPPTNTLYATGHIGEYTMAPVMGGATCTPVELSPTIHVTKECNQSLESVAGYTVIKVMYSGQVCNMSDANDSNATKLTDVTVTDDVSGVTHTIDDPLFPQNDPSGRANCASYTGYYYPSAPSSPTGDQCVNSYSDTVTATGEYKIGQDTNTTMATKTATCGLCEDCK